MTLRFLKIVCFIFDQNFVVKKILDFMNGLYRHAFFFFKKSSVPNEWLGKND